jgi:LmbE family N-acetylglucosaminyl deacetylase
VTRHLFVSPHPDDVEIGCGGLIHRLRARGEFVAIAVCTGEGDLAMLHSGETVPFKQRREEQLWAREHLLRPDIEWLGIAPASQFDRVPQADFVSSFDSLFPRFDAVYVPLSGYNDDHNRVWNAALAAMRPGKIDGVTVYAYEQPFGNHPPEFGKTYFALDRDDVGAKCSAITAHTSQMKGRMASIYGPHAASLFAALRGKEIGVTYAELYYLIRSAQLISPKATHDA